jgi:hypothetical protein
VDVIDHILAQRGVPVLVVAADGPGGVPAAVLRRRSSPPPRRLLSKSLLGSLVGPGSGRTEEPA